MATGQSFSLSLGSEPFYDFSCAPCAKDGQNMEAIQYCVDCHQNFCTKCLKDHNKFEGLRAHRILDKAGMMASGLQALAPAFQTKETCPVHQGKMMEMYCGDHDVICCGVCIPIDHRLCKGVDFIPNISKGIKTSQELKDVTVGMKQVKLELANSKNARQEDLKRIQKEKTKCLNDIDHFRNNIVKHLDTLVKKAKDDVHNKVLEMEKAINNDIQQLQDMTSALEANIKNVISCKAESELFLYVKQGKSKKDSGSQLLHELVTSASGETLVFDVNTNITAYFMNLKSIGDIKTPQKQQLGSEFQSQSNVKVRVSKPFNTATIHGDYNVKTNDDKHTCHIQECCLLEDGSVIISDTNNYKLKRLDQSYKVVDQCTLQGQWGVCSTGPTEVAVALYNNKKIQLVSTADKLKLTRSFQVDFHCGYVTFSNGELFVSGEKRVCAYSLTGNHLRTFQNDSAGQSIFSIPQHISVNNTGDQIHVIDETKGVITIDRQGHLQSTFTDPDLKNAWGVCVLENDNLLVAGYNSNNIIQIDNQGRKVQVLLSQTDGILLPRTLCYDGENARLIVTTWRTNLIKVFNLIRK